MLALPSFGIAGSRPARCSSGNSARCVRHAHHKTTTSAGRKSSKPLELRWMIWYANTSLTKYQMFIGGAWTDAVSGASFESYNVHRQAWALIPRAGPEDVDRAGALRTRPLRKATGRSSPRHSAARCAEDRRSHRTESENLRRRGPRHNGKLISEMSAQPRTWRSGITTSAASPTKSKARCCRATRPTFSITRDTSRSGSSQRSCRELTDAPGRVEACDGARAV